MNKDIISNTRNQTPLVHCITNYVTVNDCANIILASGGSPIMSEDINEVEEITSICNTLVINMGKLNKDNFLSMKKAGIMANKLSHPVILDPVAAGASKWRDVCTKELLETVKFSVIRGNISEIKAVYNGTGNTKGVDAASDDVITYENLDENIAFAKKLSKKTGAVIAISGALDIVCDENIAYVITNGHINMTKITGSGCMLTTVIGAFCGANKENILDATVVAVSAMGLCGEMANDKMLKENTGLSSFRTYLIDFMSKMDYNILEGGAKIEIRK
ncbi:MAG: hydroxyethylthiazole kinase [Clostridia bacterium]